MVNFPSEIWLRIFCFLDVNGTKQEKNYGQLLRICKAAYYAGLRVIYYYPKINARNYASFFYAITHRPYGIFVHHLNLVNATYTAKASMTSRMLRLCSKNLISFYSPQSGIGFTAFRALSQCTKLEILDLSVLTLKADLFYLFEGVKDLKKLHSIIFPPISQVSMRSINCWPTSLKSVSLSGGFTDEFLSESLFPSSIRRLGISHCPFVTDTGILMFLSRIGHQLSSLSISFPMPQLSRRGLDSVLLLCPNLKKLSISVNYITSDFISAIPEEGHGLEILDLTFSGNLISGIELLKPDNLSSALVDEKLQSLKRLRWSIQLGWREQSDEVQDLVELMNDQGGEAFVAFQ
ncbi:F-box protein Pof5 [Schizosaccharomyces japonicus yFS275]|uniref:F-box protein Pof5 n=1 Tax=Schizosaccharomyces japonicus (strain yFS275 / FY16936) TaxID=402676 RepID=B6JXT1_SCHJY|nr:F-box protein Pof5 [Schizosaccharomyces japonicus yFS275]EEB06349.1 F-box protein Pof5 [Schizosaccharomyces japonicus yFS275]